MSLESVFIFNAAAAKINPATQETLSALNAVLQDVHDALGNTLKVSGTITSTPSGTQDVNVVNAVLAVSQSGAWSVEVNNFPGVFPDQHSQPLTDTQLRATAVPVTFPAGISVNNFPAEYPLPTSQITTLITRSWTLDQATDSIAVKPRDIVSRMLNLEVTDGYTIWPEVDAADYLYILEAPIGTAASAVGFQGIRFPKSSQGVPQPPAQVNTAGTLTWDNRAVDGGWQ